MSPRRETGRGLFRFYCPNQFAGARERNRPRPLTLPRETGFAPETSRARKSRRSAALFTKQIAKKETRMAPTAAYLIALALTC